MIVDGVIGGFVVVKAGVESFVDVAVLDGVTEFREGAFGEEALTRSETHR